VVVCAGELPFSRAEIQEALSARWHLLGRESSVVVCGEGGRASVQVGAARREVDLGGRAGEDAARLVAVLALDLAQGDGAPTSVAVAFAPPAPARRDGLPVHLAATLLVPWGQPGWRAHAEPTLDVAAEVAWGLGPFLTAGYRRIEVGEGATALNMDEIPVRAGLAARRRWLELRVGGTVRPHLVSGAGSYRGAVWGGTFSGVARWRFASRLALVFAAGLELFRNRVVFRVGNENVITTSWLAPWLGAGLAWDTTP